MKKLSDKEDEFCKMVVWESFTPRAAYAVVWNPGDDASASAGASRKMREPHIQEELKRLRAELDDGYALSAKEKRRFWRSWCAGRWAWIWGCLIPSLLCRR